MSMQSLKKIGQILLKLESGNQAQTDGRMDGRTDGRTDGHSKRFGRYNIIPRHFFMAGYKKRIVFERRTRKG